MDIFGTEAKRKVAGLEDELSVFRKANGDLHAKLTESVASYERVEKTYLDQVKTTSEANAQLFAAKTEISELNLKLVDTEQERDHLHDLAEQRRESMNALNDENKDLLFQLQTLQSVLKQTNFIINVKPVRKADKK